MEDMDTHPDVVERISQKIEAYGVRVDREKVASKLNLLVSEFGIPVSEAERTVTNELMREYRLTGTGGGGGQAPELHRIGDLVPGEWVTVEGKVVSLSEPPSPAVALSGILADSSGAIRFIVWAKGSPPRLNERQWFRFEAAVADEYRGAISLKIHSGTKVTPLDEERPLLPSIVPIADLKPGIGSIRAKMVEEWEPRHDRMLQTGLLGDESGRIKFIIWKDEGKEKLDLSTVYTIYYASVEEYMGRNSLNLTTAMYIPEEGDIEIGSGEAAFSGSIVQIAAGSGLIKRCTVEGCNRVLDRYNSCTVHEMQKDYHEDLRIKAVIDNGHETRNLLMQRPVVEALTGMTLEDAKEVAVNNPLGLEDVLIRIKERVLGRYVDCTGAEFDNTFLVKECRFKPYSPQELADLINRAGSAPGGEAR
jgi:replication factor A1